MSFHTFELKQKIYDKEQSREIYEALLKSGGRFYEDKKEYINTRVCETLRDKGIIIKIRKIEKNGFKYEMIYYRMNHSQVSRHKKAQFFKGSGYFVCSQYKASASLGVSILSVPCGLFVL